MKEALLELKQQGHQLGIVTSNSVENVAAFLEAQEMQGVFDFIGSGLTLFGKGKIIQRIIKQHGLDPATVIYVGDETRDIEAARKIQVRAIAVSWGFNSSQVLAEQNPDFLIHCPSELVNVVRMMR
jgi:phosphoglycolate phosphatase-like HAD superfamily hydrolase